MLLFSVLVIEFGTRECHLVPVNVVPMHDMSRSSRFLRKIVVHEDQVKSGDPIRFTRDLNVRVLRYLEACISLALVGDSTTGNLATMKKRGLCSRYSYPSKRWWYRYVCMCERFNCFDTSALSFAAARLSEHQTLKLFWKTCLTLMALTAVVKVLLCVRASVLAAFNTNVLLVMTYIATGTLTQAYIAMGQADVVTGALTFTYIPVRGTLSQAYNA